MQEDLEVTGISRSGRVRKKSSKLMDFESPDDIEARYRKQTPVKPFSIRPEEPDYEENASQPMDEDGSGSESEIENNAESMESDSTSDEGQARTPANSLYMMEKSKKQKLIVKDGKVVGRAKAQRKDKGKSRITAYMLWAKEARNELLRKHPDLDFSAISKRLGEMWGNVTYLERYAWKRRAKRAMQKHSANPATKVIYNNTKPIRAYTSVGRPPNNRLTKPATPPSPPPQAVSAPLYRPPQCSAASLAAHLKLLGESLTIIGERLKEHEGQIAVWGSVSLLLDSLLCALAPLLGVCRALPALAPPAALSAAALHHVAYVMPGL